MAAAKQLVQLQSLPGGAQYQNTALINRLIRMWLNQCLTDVGSAVGTTTSKAKTVATATYTIDGEFKTKAATDDFWTLAGTVVAVGSFQKYLLLIDGAGAASVLEGVQALTAAAVVLPAPPDSKSILAVLTVATDATHTFTPGTTLLGAAGITATFVDGIDPSMLPTIADALTGVVVLT